MKKNILKFIFTIGFFIPNFLLAETVMPPESKPDEELNKPEAELRINDFQTRVKALEDKLKSAQQNLTDAKNKLDQAKKDTKDCNDAILAMIGASNQDLETFRQKIGVLEGKVREKKNLNDDQLAEIRADIEELERQCNELRSNKISLLPEFYNRIIALAKEIKGLYREKKIKSYTVGTWAENKDCLWNIAGRMEILGDSFLWPKLWQNNKDLIRNPDIIHPGQVLMLPEKGPKSNDEMKAERKYWRNKKAAQAEATTGAN